MAKNGRITIKEIAQEAGVSKQTVSRVLNNRPDVSPQTRHRIQEIINNINYRPSKLARSLSHGRTHTIGVISSDLRHVGPSHTLIGVDEQAYASGYTLSLSLIHETSDQETIDSLLENMLAQQVDGIIWMAVGRSNNYKTIINRLSNFPIPVVMGLEMQPTGLTAVHTDSSIGAEQAVTHLQEQGYQVIGIITGPLNEWSAQKRLKGWQNSVLQADSSLIYEGDWTAQSGYNGIQQLWQQRPDLDAVFVSNDQMALGVLKAARAMGRQVPDKLGVVGFDDIPEAVFFTPALTTVKQDLIANGRYIIQELDQQIQARHNQTPCPPKIIQTPTELIIRDSSTPKR